MREMIFARDVDPAIGTREHAHTPSSWPIKGAGIHGYHRHNQARPFIMDRAMDPGVHGNRDDGEKRTPSSDRATPPPWQHQLRRLAEAPVHERTLGRRTNGKENKR